MRISNSGANRYTGCGASYKFHYIHRWRSKIKSSALFFGTAIDAACNYMLENIDKKDEINFLHNATEVFLKEWEQQLDKDTNEMVDLPKNPYIKYFKSDFDLELLYGEDLQDLGYKAFSDIVAFRHGVEEKAKAGWLSVPENERSEYNYLNWLCLMYKGMLMVKAYYNEILPRFKKILALQKPISISYSLGDGQEDDISGIAEFVAVLEDDTICLVDNKTSGSPYADDSVRTSQQLALYKQILNILAENKADGWEHKVQKCAYAVISKKTIKTSTKTCLSCGNVATSSHKTCNAKIDDKRCDGEWTVVNQFATPTQFIIDDISEDFGQGILENFVNITKAIKGDIFPKNYDKCYNDYGSVCPFISICHKKDGQPTPDLFKLEDKKNG
jgi:PD-(D/E)XK nuclease superfamily